MRSDARRLLHATEPHSERLACSRCDRAVDSDVLADDQLLAVLAWTRVDGQVLCLTCRQAAGRPADLVDRILART
jgi:hypothetical protein